MATYGLGGSLAGAAQQQKAEANGLLAQTAKQEQQIEMTNQNLEQQRKAGNAQLGSTLGGMAGMYAATGTAVGGPWGAAIGALVGGIAGGLF
jgi:outer membrane lipoprotein SlyB